MFRIIYGDYGFRRVVCLTYEWWDAADVLLEEGWTHGTVIGVEADCLLVDFGCEGMRHQLVKYGQAFRCAQRYDEQGMWDDSQHEMGPGSAVEVLLRRAPHYPWVWRPATLLTADIPQENGGLALVELEMGGVRRREVVVFDQVRITPSAAAQLSRAIQEGEFTSRTLPLDDLTGPLAAALGGRAMRRWHCIVPFSVEKEGLVILQNISWARYQDVSTEYVQECIERFMEESGVSLEKNWCLPFGCSSCEDSSGVKWSVWTLHNVHPHVLMEMATHLDTMERVQLRRVCRAFDTFYSGTLSEDIRMTYRQWKGHMRYFRNAQLYMVAAPLLHCITSGTRRITLTKGDQYAFNILSKILGTCGQLGLSAANQRVSVLVAQCELDVFGWESGGGWAAAMTRARCRLLLFKKCTTSATSGRGLPDARFSGSLHADAGLEGLLRLVESQLPAFDVQRTAEWVAEALSGEVPDDMGILWDLGNLTSPDPRKDNIYAGRRWNEYWPASAFDFAKLSRLTQYALSRRVPINGFALLPFMDGL